MKNIAKMLGLMIIVSFFFATSSFADESEVAALKSQIQDLNGKVDSLERLVKTMEGHVTPPQGKEGMATSYVAPGQPIEGGLIHTMQDIHMGGYLDVEYNQNLSRNTTNIGGNPLRSFDNDQNTFSLNAAVLEFQKTANPEGGAGFRLDIAMGENAEAVDLTLPQAGSANGTDGDEFSLQQLFVDWVAPLSVFEGSEIFDNTIDIKVGRFVTLAGAEVIRSPDNWNVSRGLLFGLAIPFTHTGVRAAYNLFNDKVTTYWGLNNGWDNVLDNNQMKTLESGFSLKPLKDVTLTSSYYFGPENARQGGHRRFLMSNVLAWQASDKLKLMGEIDYGNERRVVGLEGRPGAVNASWHGYAAHIRYQATDKFAMAYRLEFFRDDATFRSGTSAGVDDESLWSNTATAEYLLDTNLTGRFEYRYDKSNDRNDFNGQSNQQTLGAQLIYNFA